MRVLHAPEGFQSTLPVGGATCPQSPCLETLAYFNPRSPWGERLLRERKTVAHAKFQSTLPVGGATRPSRNLANIIRFQSTLPVGGATRLRSGMLLFLSISIHAPRGGSDRLVQGFYRPADISIHAPRGGSDVHPSANFTLFDISIHAPRGGSDRIFNRSDNRSHNFNPRSPWGERPKRRNAAIRKFAFQSTLPVGGATSPGTCHKQKPRISIHAPRGGSDGRQSSPSKGSSGFQSTLPVGGATKDISRETLPSVISIHAPRGGSDW